MAYRHRLISLLVAAVFVASACSSASPTKAPTATTGATPGTPAPQATAVQTFSIPAFTAANLSWFCCLGTGDDPSQKPTEEAVAKAFATKYPGSTLKIEITTYDEAVSALSTRLGPNPPDISGPNGIGGLGTFRGQWLDLGPYLAASHYNMSEYDPKTVEFFKQDGVQIGVPFDLYPSMLWYKKDFFEEANLEEPPHQFGAKYKMPDGTEVEWNYETLRQIAMKLTVDKNGKDATEAGFDPTKIEQYGFEPQRDDLRGLGAFWGPGSLLAADGKTAQIPPAWAAAWRFVYDGIWKDHFIMNESTFNSDTFGGGDQAFFSGNVAMAENFLWFTYGVTGAGTDWDLAAIPAYNGKITAPLNADTFSIFKATKHPDAAFAAMAFLFQDKSPELLTLYGGIPARVAEQDAYFDTLGKTEGFPAKVDWQVAQDAIEYADVPNFEDTIPKYPESLVILQKYRTRWTTMPNLNFDQELVSLQQELQKAWDAG